MKKNQKIVQLLISPLSLFIILFGMMLLFPPFYGFMDDLTYLNAAKKIQESGFSAYYGEWFWPDLSHSGRLRPLLPVMVWFFYYSTMGSYLGLHILNLAISFLILWLTHAALFRFWINNQISPDVSESRLRILVFSFLLATPWTRLILTLPALQEKLVFLFAALTILWILSDYFRYSSVWIRHSILLLLLILGSFSREQFVLFYPVILACLYISGREFPWKRRYLSVGFYLALMLLIIASIWLVGRIGDYKGRYGLVGLKMTLFHSKAIWLFSFTGLLLLFKSAIQKVQGENFADRLWQRVSSGVFAWSLLGFVILMAPWGTGGYLNVVASPFFVFCLFSLLSKAFIHISGKFRLWAATNSVLLMVFLSFFLFDITTKRDLYRALDSPQMRDLGERNIPVYAPCFEGAGHLREYPLRYFGYSLDVRFVESFEGNRKSPAGTYWFLGKNLSCWPGDGDPMGLIRQGKAEVVWRGYHPWSHQIIFVKPDVL